MKTLFILLFSLNSLVLVGQDYFHKIIDFPEGVPTTAQVEQDGKDFYITSINGLSNTIVTKIDTLTYQPEYIQIDSFAASRDGFSISGDSLFLYGKNRSFIDHQELVIITEDIQKKIQVNTRLDDQYVWPIAYNYSQGFHYLGYDTKIDSLDKTTFGIQKRSSKGELIWEYFFGIENGYNSVDEIGIASNGDILPIGIATRIPPNVMNRTQLLSYRISPSGEIVHTFLQDETAEVGEVAKVAPLLNNHAVTAVNVDRTQDIEFFNNFWYPFPYKLHWVDEEGNTYMDKMIITNRPDQLYILNVTPSKYFEHFFLVGLSYDSDGEIDYGYLSKISYTGEILWERRYAHPDFFFQHNSLLFDEVKEQPNGDIYAFGKAGVINGLKDLWIMKVNSDGCFGSGGDCGETVVSTNTKNLNEPDEPILYPNPAIAELNIQTKQSSGLHTTISILDMNGILIKNVSTIENQIKIDIDSISSGMYLVKIAYHDGRTVYKKIMVL